jgi:hypothetical protein
LVAGQTAQAEQEPYTAISNLALSRIRRRLQRGRSHDAAWYAGLPEEERDALRPLGRRLVDLVSEYLSRGSRRGPLLDEARGIAREYGTIVASDGLSFRDTLDAFVFFRKTLDETAMEEAQKSDMTVEKALELWELLSTLEEQMLLSIAESYEQAEAVTARR